MPVIACLGDSLTGGMFTNGYPTALQSALDQRQPGQFVVKKHGIAGCDVNAWLSQQLSSPGYKQAVAGGCDAVVLMLGTNDARIGSGFSEQQFSDKMRQLVNRIKSDAPGAQIFLATPTPVSAGDASKCYDPQIIHNVYPRLFPQIAASCGASCIDCCSALGGAGAGQHLFGDGVHLSQAGDSMLASAICDHVMRVSGRGGAGGGSPSSATSPTNAGSVMSPWGARSPSPSASQFREGIPGGSANFTIPGSFGSISGPSTPTNLQGLIGSIKGPSTPTNLQGLIGSIKGPSTPTNLQGLRTSSFAMGQVAPVQKIVDVPQVQRLAQSGPQAWQGYMNSAGVGPVRKFAEGPQVQSFPKMVEAPQVQKIQQGMTTRSSVVGTQGSVVGTQGFTFGARSTAPMISRAGNAYRGRSPVAIR